MKTEAVHSFLSQCAAEAARKSPVAETSGGIASVVCGGEKSHEANRLSRLDRFGYSVEKPKNATKDIHMKLNLAWRQA